MLLEIKSVNLSLKITQIIFHMFGIWRLNYLTGFLKHLYNFYSLFSFMFVIGTYVIVQTGDLVQVWGNLSYMTANVFLLFTNLVLGHKALNAMLKKKVIQDMLAESYLELEGETRITGRAIVTSSDDETTRWFALYASLTFMTVSGWALSAEKNQLPLRAWYPYDTSKTPAYQLTYAHQSITIFMAAAINVCVDTLVTSMMAMCRCRLRLLGLSLTTLCDGQEIAEDGRLTVASDKVVSGRLRHCATRHQAVLTQVADLQSCFSMPLLSQFTVSMVINCVTAYQLAFESPSLVRIISMITYLLGMLLQVFIYCYQGNRLFEESEAVSMAAYECPWYTCSIPVRRALLIVMTRTRLAAELTAGGFTQLSLPTFMAIIKTSYTFFTVLQQVKET